MNRDTWQRVKSLLADALDQPTADREAYLQAHCSDPALADEIRAYLREHHADRDFLEGRPSGPHTADDSDAPDDAGPHGDVVRMLEGRSSPLGDLDAETLGSILSAMEAREYAAGERLIRQGDPGEYLLLIVEGRAVARVRDAPADREPVGEFDPGDTVGEMSLITDEPRTADVFAVTPVRALLLSAAAFHDVADRYPSVRVLLTNVVADRLGQATYDGLGGKAIHGYRIDCRLGRGGMGIVYDATRLATGDRVALKMMNHRLLYQPDAIKRFRREAATLEALDHVSIPRLYECFAAYKTQFLAMEFCEGVTLHDVVSGQGPLDEPIVRRIVGQLAIVLRYVHARGLVHRDLKPSNVMLTRSGVVKLLDFGIVMPSMSASVPAPNASRTTSMIGTLRYMAPEQFSHEPTDYRVDYYGLACVAFEALTGRPAIDSDDLVDVVLKIGQFALAPASRIGAGVTADMHGWLARGLQPRPADRLIDLDALAAWAGPVDPPMDRVVTDRWT
jgi:serine/threonine-protein kinase